MFFTIFFLNRKREKELLALKGEKVIDYYCLDWHNQVDPDVDVINVITQDSVCLDTNFHRVAYFKQFNILRQ